MVQPERNLYFVLSHADFSLQNQDNNGKYSSHTPSVSFKSILLKNFSFLRV